MTLNNIFLTNVQIPKHFHVPLATEELQADLDSAENTRPAHLEQC
jgi:hypothetical protein